MEVFGVKRVEQKYVNLMGACVYTGKTPDQLDHAVRKGYLRQIIAKDKSRSFLIEDLDCYMSAGEVSKKKSLEVVKNG